MSLQVQSSQQPASGRRTPQVYQNFGTASTTPPASGGNSKSSSKAPSKTNTSGKQSPVVVLETVAAVGTEAAPKESSKGVSSVAVAVTKLATSPTVNSPKVADKEKDKDEKPAATNGSTNGSHSDKESNGKHEEAAAPVLPAPETPKKGEEKENKVKDSPKASPHKTPLKSESIPVEQPKTPESASKKTPVVTPEQKKRVESSLVAEKTLKGFTAEGDEMESLVVEPSEYEDSPMPPRTGGKTKLLKYALGPPTRARISPFRINEATSNASTAVNLSTVSEGQTSVTESNEASPAADFNRPLRTISGRRTTRPISDIQFSYRKSAELNDSVSSLNVTVGSEIHNDSLRTPAPGSSRKRRAMTPESTSDALDVKENVDSPKRGRLDFSGFLGMVASPVTMLKNRLSRVRLHASTPVAKRNFDEEDPTKVVTAEATTTTANISGEAAKMEVESDEEKKVEDVEQAEGGGEPQGESATKEGQTELPESAEEAKEDGASGDGSEPVEVKDVTDKQRQFCIVM